MRGSEFALLSCSVEAMTYSTVQVLQHLKVQGSVDPHANLIQNMTAKEATHVPLLILLFSPCLPFVHASPRSWLPMFSQPRTRGTARSSDRTPYGCICPAEYSID